MTSASFLLNTAISLPTLTASLFPSPAALSDQRAARLSARFHFDLDLGILAFPCPSGVTLPICRSSMASSTVAVSATSSVDPEFTSVSTTGETTLLETKSSSTSSTRITTFTSSSISTTSSTTSLRRATSTSSSLLNTISTISTASASASATSVSSSSSGGLSQPAVIAISTVVSVVGVLLLGSIFLCCHNRRRGRSLFPRGISPIDDDEIETWKGSRRPEKGEDGDCDALDSPPLSSGLWGSAGDQKGSDFPPVIPPLETLQLQQQQRLRGLSLDSAGIAVGQPPLPPVPAMPKRSPSKVIIDREPHNLPRTTSSASSHHAFPFDGPASAHRSDDLPTATRSARSLSLSQARNGQFSFEQERELSTFSVSQTPPKLAPAAVHARAPNSRVGLTDEAIPGAPSFLPSPKRHPSRLSKMPPTSLAAVTATTGQPPTFSGHHSAHGHLRTHSATSSSSSTYPARTRNTRAHTVAGSRPLAPLPVLTPEEDVPAPSPPPKKNTRARSSSDLLGNAGDPGSSSDINHTSHNLHQSHTSHSSRHSHRSRSSSTNSTNSLYHTYLQSQQLHHSPHHHHRIYSSSSIPPQLAKNYSSNHSSNHINSHSNEDDDDDDDDDNNIDLAVVGRGGDARRDGRTDSLHLGGLSPPRPRDPNSSHIGRAIG